MGVYPGLRDSSIGSQGGLVAFSPSATYWLGIVVSATVAAVCWSSLVRSVTPSASARRRPTWSRWVPS